MKYSTVACSVLRMEFMDFDEWCAMSHTLSVKAYNSKSRVTPRQSTGTSWRDSKPRLATCCATRLITASKFRAIAGARVNQTKARCNYRPATGMERCSSPSLTTDVGETWRRHG